MKWAGIYYSIIMHDDALTRSAEVASKICHVLKTPSSTINSHYYHS